MKNKKAFIPVLIILLLAILFWYLVPAQPKGTYVSYGTFSENVGEGKVEKAEIGQNWIFFLLKGSEDLLRTDNPQSASLKENLLLASVQVTEETSVEDSVTFVFDMLFNVIFIGLIIGGVGYLLTLPGRTFVMVKHEKTRFKDIAGLDNVIRETQQLVDQLKHPQEYEKKGIRQPNGILLVGPPGNGKTLLAKAIAGEAGMNFFATKATDFQSSFMAIGPAKVKALFRRARKHTPCIVFIDEFDGIAERRNYAGQGIDKENNRIITSLLNELDGFEGHRKGVLVIGATNNAADLDPAAIRAGRFDRKYLVPNPDSNARWQLITLYLRGRELDESVSKDKLVSQFNGISAALIETIINEALIVAETDKRSSISSADIKQAMIRCAAASPK